MKIARVTIANCKSYAEEVVIELDSSFNIFVGPNGGGKSNTLDILTIVLRHFFLTEYRIQDVSNGHDQYQDLQDIKPFQDINRILEKHVDHKTVDSVIRVDLIVGDSDVSNIRTLGDNLAKFKEVATKFRNFRWLDQLPELAKADLNPGSVLQYTIRNNSLEGANDPERATFLNYLVHINLLLLLASEANIAGLRPVFTYFSPYRSAGSQDLRANLSESAFQSQLASHANSNSHAPSSLLKLATFYFGELQRGMEVRAKEAGYLALWSENGEVKKVTEYLDQLGYTWSVSILDERKNIYQIDLKRGKRTFSIEQASSGEKEILTFVLGIFALRTAGGLIVVDEPEVHLHPRWQATLRNMLVRLAEQTDNQVVLSTHSPVFINPSTVQFVRRVYMTASGETRIANNLTEPAKVDKEKDAWHVLNSHNNERVFFADRVVLVEGIQDRILFEAVFSLVSKAINSQEVVEFVEVHGKNNFITYGNLLTRIKADYRILADLDYATNIGSADIAKLFVTNFKAIDRFVLKNKTSEDRVTLAEMLEEALGNGDLGKTQEFWKYITGRFKALREDLTAAEYELLETFLAAKDDEGVHLFRSGEIEAYLPQEAESLSGTIKLVSVASLAAWLLATWDTDETQEILNVCTWILGIEQSSVAGALDSVRASLLRKPAPIAFEASAY